MRKAQTQTGTQNPKIGTRSTSRSWSLVERGCAAVREAPFRKNTKITKALEKQNTFQHCSPNEKSTLGIPTLLAHPDPRQAVPEPDQPDKPDASRDAPRPRPAMRHDGTTRVASPRPTPPTRPPPSTAAPGSLSAAPQHANTSNCRGAPELESSSRSSHEARVGLPTHGGRDGHLELWVQTRLAAAVVGAG